MQTLSTQSFEEIRRWMHRNARPLDLARWRYHFENGSKDGVLHALAAYQNEDGGFGHGLEPDNWNPGSSPFTTGSAIDIFRELDIRDPQHPMVEKALGYLYSTECFPGMGWPFTVPTNSDHPHAPWWAYSPENNAQNGFHASGNLAGYILRCADREGPLYHKALSIAEAMVHKLRTAGTTDIHEIGANGMLLRDILASGVAQRFDGDELRARLCEMVSECIERNPGGWATYSMRPSHFIDSPENLFYAGNEDVLAAELDYIIGTRHPGGVWDIYWSWSDYPKEFAIAERWWQGNLAIRYLLLLRRFGRLESIYKAQSEPVDRFGAKGYAAKECVAVYYTQNMDETVKWFRTVLGWHGEVFDRNETGDGVYGFVSDMPKELVVSNTVPFHGFHLFCGEPFKKTVALVQVQGIDSFYSHVKQNGWGHISDIHPSGAGAQTCDLTTPDGSTLMVFA